MQMALQTARYYKFLDKSHSKQVLAEAIKEAYGDLFDINIKANELANSEVKNKFRTLTQGKNSDKVISLMTNTFKALVEYAEWNTGPTTEKPNELKPNLKQDIPTDFEEIDDEPVNKKPSKMQLHYNIQIHLPESRDAAVYDALFKSLKKHLF